MGDGNGAHVTWRELNLALAPVKTDLAELKRDMRTLVEAHAGDRALAGSRAFWVNAWLLILTSFIGAAVGTGCWFIFGS